MVAGRIHPNDGMLDPRDVDGEHYDRCGRSALGQIEAALSGSGRTFADVDRCLDMASGYGRVTRLLAQRMPPDRITACDVNAEAVEFCAGELGVRPLLSDPEFEGAGLEEYDLIWVGSLVTHLDERLLSRFTSLLPRILAPGGLLLVTTLGDYGIQDVSRYEERLAGRQDELEREYRDRGFAFVAYEGSTEGQGYAWMSTERIRDAVATPFGGEVSHRAALPRGWDDHQDVHVFERARA